MVIMKRKISDLKVAELRVELEKRGLESKGLKGVLVQRLQKAIEDDGGDSSEIEVFGSEIGSPKTTGRRSISRAKRATTGNTETESEPSQGEEQESTPKPQADDTVPTLEGEKEEEGESTEKIPTDTNGPEQIESVADERNENDDAEDTEYSESASYDGDIAESAPQEGGNDEGTPTRDEEDDDESHQSYHELPDEGGDSFHEEPEVAEETFGSTDSALGAEASSGNNYREEEAAEEETEAQEEEEEEEEDDDEGGDESEMMVTVEEAPEGEEESDAGHVIPEEEETEQSLEAGDELENEPKTFPEQPIQKEVVDGEEDLPVDAVIKSETGTNETDTAEKPSDVKPKSEANVKEDVSVEVDFLDMLDYDLEITGEHNNITPSEDQSGKSDATASDNSTAKEHKTPAKSDDNSRTTPEERKSRPDSDSSKPSNSSDQPNSATQSSSKSGVSAAGKDGNKSSSLTGKRDASAVSASKKDDNPNRNLWISGLSSTTRASELKSAFSRYGKVIGAKVVTNVKSPGSRCYGYVTMATADAASKCILHLNNTDMHGRMITVEIAKGDPSASSKKASSISGSVKKESDAKVSSKSKDADSNPGSTSSRRASSGAQSSNKDDGALADGKDKSEGEKKSEQDSRAHEGEQTTRRSTADDTRKSGRSKSPARDRTRAERTSTTGPRSGDKRHGNRSPGYGRGMLGRSEPERKRQRPPDAGDRKVVLDSNKGELRVNVSRAAGMGGPGRNARWQPEPKPRPLLSRRRSASPVRRRGFSPSRGSAHLRIGGTRGGRGGRGGKMGLITRQAATFEDRNATRGARGQRTGQILSFNQIRAQQRDRVKGATRGGRGGMSRGDLAADRERLRREREERDRLRIEREKLERERRQLEKDRQERGRLEAERLRLEQERKRELEKIEKEKAEMRRLQEITRYEVEQRQRAIKRTYDTESGSHRSGRNSASSYEPKRLDRDGRSDMRRGERDDRRGYDSHARGAPTRNGPANEPPPPGTTDYRSRQGSYRGSTGGGPDIRGKPGAGFDGRRGQVSRPEARYAGSTGSASGGTVEKYIRRSSDSAGRGGEYSQPHGFGRTATDRRATPRAPRDNRDGRKVVRERPAEHRSGASPEYRRAVGRSGAAGRIEITREQSPATRRARRDGSPPSSGGRGGPPSGSRSGASWRDSGKGARDSSGRHGGPDDRDLREQLRGRQDSYSESGRGNQRRESRSNRSPSPPSRTAGGQYQGRWPESGGNASSAQQIFVGSNGAAIPTQTGHGGSNAAWRHVQQWQQGSTQSARAWPATAIPTAPTVNRQIIPPYGTLPTALIAPPGTALIPATQEYNADRQSRSFQNSYNQKPIQRRF